MRNDPTSARLHVRVVARAHGPLHGSWSARAPPALQTGSRGRGGGGIRKGRGGIRPPHRTHATGSARPPDPPARPPAPPPPRPVGPLNRRPHGRVRRALRRALFHHVSATDRGTSGPRTAVRVAPLVRAGALSVCRPLRRRDLASPRRLDFPPPAPPSCAPPAPHPAPRPPPAARTWTPMSFPPSSARVPPPTRATQSGSWRLSRCPRASGAPAPVSWALPAAAPSAAGVVSRA
jgi:hypothetical protein